MTNAAHLWGLSDSVPVSTFGKSLRRLDGRRHLAAPELDGPGQTRESSGEIIMVVSRKNCATTRLLI